MDRIKIRNILIAASLTLAMTFSGFNGVVYAGKPNGTTFNADSPDKDGTIMQYNARPEVVSASWLNKNRNVLAVEFSEEMAVTGKYSVLNAANYEISNDSGKTWVPVSKIGIRSIEAVDSNSKVEIQLNTRLSLLDNKSDMIRVLEVADRDDKRTLNEYTLLKLKDYEIGVERIRNVSVVNPRLITFETDFRIMKISTGAFTVNLGSDTLQAVKAEFKNSEKGSAVSVFLGSGSSISPDLANLKSFSINTGAFCDFFSMTNTSPLEITRKGISDKVAPHIIDAKTLDQDSDGHVDGILLLFDEVVRRKNVDTAEIKVSGYSIRKILAKEKALKIELNEKKSFDTEAKPLVKFSGGISDLSDNIFPEDADGVSVSDGVNPMLVAVKIISNGKKNGFGNNIGDAISFVFSEPVCSRFQDNKHPLDLELASIFECIENGNIKRVFWNGRYEAKDIGTYFSNELTIVIYEQAMGGTIRKGDLVRIKNSEFIKDGSGRGISDNQGLVRIK